MLPKGRFIHSSDFSSIRRKLIISKLKTLNLKSFTAYTQNLFDKFFFFDKFHTKAINNTQILKKKTNLVKSSLMIQQLPYIKNYLMIKKESKEEPISR
jgi:hypothetical protein